MTDERSLVTNGSFLVIKGNLIVFGVKFADREKSIFYESQKLHCVRGGRNGSAGVFDCPFG